MKRFYSGFSLMLIMALMMTLSTNAQKKRIGYIQSWQAQLTADQASKLTHVVYSFVTIHPDLDGKLNPINGAYLRTMTSIAHSKGAKAILAVGGWFPCSYAYQVGACTADANPEAFNAVSKGNARTKFINNLYNMVIQYNLDGIDVDWEYPSASSQGLYVDLLAALRAKMNTHPSKRLELSTAVPASAFRGKHFLSRAFQYLDEVNIMAYDNAPRIHHSTYNFAANAINYWQGRGISNSKLHLGLPFYGWNSSGNSKAYKDIVATDGSAPNKIYANKNVCDQSNGYGYNAKKLIGDKVQLALNEGIGGIMIWAIDQDHSNASHSLLNVINSKLNNGGGTGSCKTWAAGTQYYVGDIVTYNGNKYICTNNNPGYNPVISTWFWNPTSNSCSGGNNGGQTCPAWATGTQYYKGNIVTYKGANYLCKYDNPGYDPIISSWFWQPTSAGCNKSAALSSDIEIDNMNVNVYPNPLTSNILNFDIELGSSSQVGVKIFDIQGRVIKNINLGTMDRGSNNFQLDASNLGSGSYLVNIISEQITKTKRLTVM